MPDNKKADTIDNTWSSAKTRGQPSSPAKWLVSRRKVLCGPQTLDYGCGRGEDATFFKWDKYDPHYAPEKPTRKYNYITCFYVLNVVTPKVEKDIIKKVLALLNPMGVAYFAVRRDAGLFEHKPKGYKQRWVELKYPAIRFHRRRV